ncbi:MAG: fructosamine kinase family protein [Bacteroidota bacterium]
MSLLPPAIASHLQQRGIIVQRFQPVTGGCINQGGKITTPDGNFFLKWNHAAKFPQMFLAEARGLQIIGQTASIRVPAVVQVAHIEEWQYLLLEWIDGFAPSVHDWRSLGEQLAALHHHSATQFGLDHDNYIGSLAQKNTPTDNWIEFLVQQRLAPQLALLKNTAIRQGVQKLIMRLPDLLPTEPAALLHGDLWRGNLITDGQGQPCLIDPAVYYGHREAELAFTRLFGGFHPGFYDAYQQSFPLLPGFEERVEIYHLYPLLVHYNLFGGSYLLQAERIIKRYR